MGWKRKIKDGPKIFGSSGLGCCVLKWERSGRSRFRGGVGGIESLAWYVSNVSCLLNSQVGRSRGCLDISSY